MPAISLNIEYFHNTYTNSLLGLYQIFTSLHFKYEKKPTGLLYMLFSIFEKLFTVEIQGRFIQ